jgi:hypothetical protein
MIFFILLNKQKAGKIILLWENLNFPQGLSLGLIDSVD